MSDAAGDTRLQRIQALQFRDKSAAEGLLLEFVRETFPQLDVIALELRPLAVSLNSFNGFLTLRDGGRLFYKTHVEPGSVINEYYNSTLLAEAGYPVVKPIYSSTEYGKQFLIYDVIESPSVFDVAREIEQGKRSDLDQLAVAQNQSDDQLLQIYVRSLEPQTAEQAGKAAVHQLFYHRLGERYQQFYVGKQIQLPGIILTWEEICARRWVINGVAYRGTIGEAVDLARRVLTPARAGPSVIGHGDAHNGNVFFTPDGLVYFDPAFGGRHHPLLDVTKPLFHNVFATWMYHPQEVGGVLKIDFRDDGTTLQIEHDYPLSACRRMFFTSKMERVVKPLLGMLAQPDWRAFLKSALMCCPMLTMNLADANRFMPAAALLGLCYVAEMGLDGTGGTGDANRLNRALDAITQTI